MRLRPHRINTRLAYSFNFLANTGDFVAITGFQFGYDFGKGIAHIIECDAVENDAEWVRLISQGRRCRREHASAQFALPQLDDLKSFTARALADKARAAAVRTPRGWFDGVRNAMGVCK